MPPAHVNELCRRVGYWPERRVTATRPAAVQGVTVVTLECRHDVERGRRPKVGSVTLCEVCARWEGSRQRAAVARKLDTPERHPDNSTTPT